MAVMLANLPEVIFEVAWTSAPLDTAPTWVDESAYVRINPSIHTRRGRQSELEEFSYGAMGVELSNRTRRFDPTYSAGALYGNLLPRKQCRLRLKWSGTTYDVFKGWLTGIPQNYAAGGVDATVTLEAVDSLALLGEMGLSLDPFTTISPQPAGFLHQVDGSTWVDSIAGASYQATALASAAKSSDINGGGGTAVPSIYNGRTGWRSTLREINSAHTFSVWVSGATLATLGSDNRNMFLCGGDQIDPALGANYHLSAVTNAGSDFKQPAFKASWYDGTTSTELIFGYGAFDGQPHNVTVTVTAGSAIAAYVDGVLSATATLAGTLRWSSLYYAIGGYPFAAVSSTDAGSWVVQDVAVWSSALSAANVLAWYNAGKSKIIEPTTTRAARYLDNVSWPSAWRDLAPTSGLGSARGECGDVQQSGFAHNALNICAATEQGRYFAKANGDVAFYGRYYAFETTRGKTVQATFSDDGAGINYIDTGIDWSDREVNNDITINWSDDPARRSTDSASITALTRQSKTIDTVLSTSAQATDMAAGLVQWRKDMVPRTRGISVQGGSQTSQWATLLGLEIGDRIQHEITPMAVGSQDVRTMTLEAIEWDITGDDMIVTFYGSPIPSNVFVLDSSLLDTDRLGF